MTTKADCWFFLNNRCTKGEKCEFRHYEPARFATSDCLYWLSGECAKTDCPFWHPQKPTFAAAKGGPTSLKPTPCYYFSIGACRNGDGCAFVHDSRLVSQKVHADELQADDQMLSPPPEPGKQCVQKESLQVSTGSRADNAVGKAFRHEKVNSEGQQLDSRRTVGHGPATTMTRPSGGISPASNSVQPTLFSSTRNVNPRLSVPRIAKLSDSHGLRSVSGSRQVPKADLEDGEIRTVNPRIDTSRQNIGRKRDIRSAGLTSSHMSRHEGAVKERPEAPHLVFNSPAAGEARKSGIEKEVHSLKGARQTIAISMRLREERFQSGKENSTSKLQARLGPSPSKIGLKNTVIAHSEDPKPSGGATAHDRRRLIGGGNNTAKPAFEVKSFEDIIKEKRQKEDRTALKTHVKSEKGIGSGVLGGASNGAAEQTSGTGNGTKSLTGQKRRTSMTDAKESLVKAKTAGDDFKVLSFEEIMAAKKKTIPRRDDKRVDGNEGKQTVLNVGEKGIYVPPVNAGKRSSDCLQDQKMDSKLDGGPTGVVKKTAPVATQRKGVHVSASNVGSIQELAVLATTPLPNAVSVERLERPSSQSAGSAAGEEAVSVEVEKSSADVFHNAGVAPEPALPSQFDDDFDKEIAEFEALLGS